MQCANEIRVCVKKHMGILQARSKKRARKLPIKGAMKLQFQCGHLNVEEFAAYSMLSAIYIRHPNFDQSYGLIC